jgi:hypothetical protein
MLTYVAADTWGVFDRVVYTGDEEPSSGMVFIGVAWAIVYVSRPYTRFNERSTVQTLLYPLTSLLSPPSPLLQVPRFPSEIMPCSNSSEHIHTTFSSSNASTHLLLRASKP